MAAVVARQRKLRQQQQEEAAKAGYSHWGLNSAAAQGAVAGAVRPATIESSTPASTHQHPIQSQVEDDVPAAGPRVPPSLKGTPHPGALWGRRSLPDYMSMPAYDLEELMAQPPGTEAKPN